MYIFNIHKRNATTFKSVQKEFLPHFTKQTK